MMSGTNGKKKLSALLLASLMTTSLAFADSYKNNVVDVRVNKESGNAVKVMIYTDRPYTDPVVVNKKANNKYVILMPETKSNMKSSPKMNNVSGTVSNVTVNTQSVSGGKGYTKIIITSEHAINVVPRTQQLATSKHTHQADTKVTKTTKPTTVAKNTTQKTAAKPAKPKTAETKKPTTVKTATNNQKHFINPIKKAAKPEVKPVTKKAVKQAAKPVAKPVTTPKKVAAVPAKKPIDILEHEVKTNTNAPLVDNQNDNVLNKEIQNNDAKIEQQQHEKRLKRLKKRQEMGLDKPVKQHSFDLTQLGIWKLLLLAGAITFPILVIMIILALDKKINKKIEKNFKHEERENNLGNTYIPSNKPLDGGEYTEPEYQEPTLPEPDEPAPYTSFDDMLNKVEQPTYQEQIARDGVQNTAPQQDETFTNDYSDEDFEHDFSNEAENASADVSQTIEEMTQNNTQAPQNIADTETQPVILTEPVQQENVPETPVADNVQKTEPLIDKPAEVSVPEKVAPPENQYNPDGYLSDFSNIDDKDFFDELTMQTMAQNNSANGLPEQSPADEIFDFISDDDTAEEQTENVQVQPQEPVVPKEEKVPAQTMQPVQEPVQQEPKAPVEDEDDDEDLTMLTEVQLNDHSGIYLVNYDNFSSLVGHIDDNYFVLKKFNSVVNDKIYMKETEKTDNATRYIVKVGKNKMVIEVSDTSMSRLLDL